MGQVELPLSPVTIVVSADIIINGQPMWTWQVDNGRGLSDSGRSGGNPIRAFREARRSLRRIDRITSA